MQGLARLALVLFLLLIGSGAEGAGYAIWEMGTHSAGMGGVATASIDDASAVFFNPAALVRLEGTQIHLALTGIKPYQTFSGALPGPGYGVTEELDDPFFLLPQAYLCRRLSARSAAGIGVTTPYGLRVEWKDPANFSGRYISTHSELTSTFISPTLAWAPTERLSVGLGLNIVLSSVTLERYIVRNLPDPTYIGRVKLEGDGDTALGFNLGILLDLDAATRLGLSYKSRIDLDFTGKADFTAFDPGIPLADSGAKTSLPLPSLFTLGLARRFGERLLVALDYNRYQWSAFETLNLEFSDLDETEQIREEYVNSGQLRLGAEYQARSDLILRGGIVFDQSPQPEGSVGPVLPDADRTGLSLGASYQIGALRLEAYNLLLFFADRRVRQNFDGFNGDYQNFTNLFGLGLHYRL